MNSFKVLQVIDTLDIGGAERVFIDINAILFENKVEVTSFFLTNSGVLSKELNPKINKIELNRKNKLNLITMYKCSRILSQYSIIHCHLRHVYNYITLVSKMFFLNSKIILHDHSGLIEVDRNTRFLFNSFFKPKFYIGVSKSLTNWANESLKINSNAVFLLQNIIIKKEFDKNKNTDIDLLLVSNIKPNKNNKFVVNLSNKINKRVSLIGNVQDEKYYQELVLQMKDSNCNFISNDFNSQYYMRNAKFGLHTSIYESGPLVLIEYLSQKLPFLAYETGEVATILKPFFPDYFIDNLNVNDWVDRITLLYNLEVDEEKMETVFNTYFGKEKYFNELLDIYKCILKN